MSEYEEGLQAREVEKCSSCGFGILHDGPLFYETIIRTHSCDMEHLKLLGDKIPKEEVISKVQGVRKALICKRCGIEAEDDDDDDEPKSLIIH